ncbi:MAG: cohesin domain-containing protein [bacterium]|nr:cohesin domain-containing protein [bacterium]
MPRPNKIGEFLVTILMVGGVFLALPHFAQAAASIYVQPVGGTFTVGSTFDVSVYVNTGGQSVNAVQANLSFPPDKLQVVSPMTGKSLIQVWVAQPTFSNENGTIKFQGTIPSPGINTDAGLISTVTFRVKSVGQATVRISDSSQVLLNDGKGTDVLGQTTDGIYNLTLPPPAGPIVNSRTNPDQGKWYTNNSAVLEWAFAPDAQGYSYILSDDLAIEPDSISEGLQTRVNYPNLVDGTHYFHIKALRQGVWGGTTTYILNIDSTPPAEFPIAFSPGARTSNKRPLIDFSTTDKISGLDHYEIKIIPLDPPIAYTGENQTPFFFEVTSPYSREFTDGRYEIFIRAFDGAGNYYQAQERLSITRPLFEFIVTDGLRIGGGYVLTWPWLVVWGAILLVILSRLSGVAWRWHRSAEELLMHGPMKHPKILDKLEQLKEKLKEYGHHEKPPTHFIILLVFALAMGATFGNYALAQENLPVQTPSARETLGISNLSVEPPVVTLFPKSISNDEIVYIGGRAGAPQSKVLIYIQNLETGSTLSHIAVTDKNGEWFYSLPEFLDAGNYVVWTQFQLGDELSPPSSRLDLKVARTAIQVGGTRISFENFYLILLLAFASAFFALLFWTLHHLYHGSKKRRKFHAMVGEAEESIRRGFATLRKDIEDELEIIRKAKLNKELSGEEKLREEKLLRDLEDVGRHVGKEVWEIERSGR